MQISQRNDNFTEEKRQRTRISNTSSTIGKASCLSLLTLAFLLINPIANSSARALEDSENSSEITNQDANVMPAATASTVNISFTPSSGSTSLTPTTSGGQSAQINVTATVSVQNSGGYAVYLKSNTKDLVGEKSANIIPGATTAKTYKFYGFSR